MHELSFRILRTSIGQVRETTTSLVSLPNRCRTHMRRCVDYARPFLDEGFPSICFRAHSSLVRLQCTRVLSIASYFRCPSTNCYHRAAPGESALTVIRTSVRYRCDLISPPPVNMTEEKRHVMRGGPVVLSFSRLMTYYKYDVTASLRQ